MNQGNRNVNKQRVSYWRSFTVLIVIEFFALALFYIILILLKSSETNTFIDIKYSLETFEEDLVKHGFKESLYDIIFIALWRALVLLVAYSACRSTLRAAIALTVLLSTIYIAVKIILSSRVVLKLYKESFVYLILLEYAFMFISLITHWITLILFEILYRPSELRVPFPKGFLSYYDQYKKKQMTTTIRDVDGEPGEREPLLNNNNNNHQQEPILIQTSDREEFHSPDQSLRGSPILEHTPPLGAGPIMLSEEDRLYKNTSEECVLIITNLISSNGWQEENTLDDIVCYSKRGLKGKIYKCQGELPMDAATLCNKLYDETVHQARWNSEVTDIHILKRIDDDTDLIYIASSKPPGGMIQQRDFVQVRIRAKKNGSYYIVGRSVDYTGCPHKPGFIRGENGPGGYVIQPILAKPNSCTFIYILDTSLKGWLPQVLIDQTLSSILLRSYKNLANYVQQQLT